MGATCCHNAAPLNTSSLSNSRVKLSTTVH